MTWADDPERPGVAGNGVCRKQTRDALFKNRKGENREKISGQHCPLLFLMFGPRFISPRWNAAVDHFQYTDDGCCGKEKAVCGI